MSSVNEIEELLKQSAAALREGEYAKAEPLQRQAVELLRQAKAEARVLSPAIETLAGIHFFQGKFGIAASEYGEALQLSENEAPPDDTILWRLSYWHGLSHFKTGTTKLRKPASGVHFPSQKYGMTVRKIWRPL